MLLRVSSDVFLVDPHFHPDKKAYLDSLHAILNVAYNDESKRFGAMKFHTKVVIAKNSSDQSESIWIDEFHKSCERELPRIIPKGRSLDVVLWKVKADGEAFHARYVLTDIGGISVDHGLDTPSSQQTTDIHWLMDSELKERWRDFLGNGKIFLRVAQKTYLGR
ncbi:MAG: hypothetical protein SGI77_23775 [Pirellulaceae bacterium]|nr:hypothetical protein [Pirellulaceae bacterium]